MMRGRRETSVAKILARVLTLVVGCLALAGIAAAAPASPPRTPVRIEVPSNTNLQFFTLWVALGAGFFQQEGLEPPMFLGMIAEDKPIQLFASLLANEPINLVVRADVAAARKLQTNVSLKERLEAIRGLKVGVAGEPPPRLRALFASAGMNADRDVQLVIIHGPDQVQALADHQVDALFSHTPYLETALVKYKAVLLVQTSAGEVKELADGQIHALATTRAVAQEKPDLILKVARAIYRAQKLIHSDQKATVDAILASNASGQDRALVEAIAAVYGPAVPQTPPVSQSGIERAAILFPAHPRAPDFKRVKAADFIANSFAELAVAQIH